MYKKAVARFETLEHLISKLFELQLATNTRIMTETNRTKIFRLQIRARHFENKRLRLQAEQTQLRNTLVPDKMPKPLPIEPKAMPAHWRRW